MPLKSFSTLISSICEPKIVEGSIQAVNRITYRIANSLQKMQSGEIRSYAAWLVIGAVIFMLTFVI